MLFNSFEFLLFLPIVFLLYWFVFRGLRLQNLFVIVASYFFYGWWDWRFLILITLTSFVSYESGILIERNEGKRNRQKILSAANIIFNLSVLGVFKYYNFFIENLVALFNAFNWHIDTVTMNIILPVGISFYTFQALSYTIDVYQRKIHATHDIGAFFAYICFFPQLVAGPIERATNLLPQFQRRRHFDYSNAVDGCWQMLWGFAKKLIVADNCAIVVNDYWTQYEELSGLTLFYLGVLFTFQIYCDFSGYSDIAIGTARLFGFNLRQNFAYPYFSRGIPEFWRRWHISLMTWFRDYVYFPLGGSKSGLKLAIRNIFIVWTISGLWHGANWTFVCWGLYHAILMVIYRILPLRTKYDGVVADKSYLPNIKEIVQIGITFFFVVIGWIIFRAENMAQAFQFITRMFTTIMEAPQLPSYRPLAYLTIMVIVEWIQRKKRHALQFDSFHYSLIKWIICVMVMVSIYFFMADDLSPFIYFQF